MALIIVGFLLFVSTNGQTCPAQGRKCDRPGECCSKWGYCGTTEAYCKETYDFSQSGCPECICEGDEQGEEGQDEQEEEQQQGSPTTQPTEPFEENCNCICYGDPHCKMWNCAINNWQGPHNSDPIDVYYMTRCNGYSFEDMPFDLIGVNQRYDNYFTSLDYTILKLHNAELEICIKNKGNEGVSYNDCNNINDITNTNIIPNENEAISIGNIFEINWRFENGYSKLYLKVLNNECSDGGYHLSIITHTATEKEEAVEIRVSECYKAYTCGMCGDFFNTGLTFQTSDGNTIELDPGAWGGTANDETGLTYMVGNDVPATETPMRRLQDENTKEIFVEPCYGLKNEIEIECNKQLKEYAKCCWDRKEFCQDIIISCGWDSCSCVMGKTNNLTQTQYENTVDLCIKSVLNASMSFVCGLDYDSFIVPDMTIYDNKIDSEKVIYKNCEKCNVGGNIFIGIVIGLFVFGIIVVVVYLLVIKPKLNAKQFREMNSVENELPDVETNNTTLQE